jgi:hypothetical protein
MIYCSLIEPVLKFLPIRSTMKFTRQSYRLPVILLAVLVILSSGTATGFAGISKLDVPVGRRAADQNEQHHRTCRLAYTLEDPFITASTATVKVVSGVTSTNTEQGQASNVQADTGRATVPPLGTYVKEFVPDVIGGTKRVFSGDNLPVVLIGVGLTGLALTGDQRVKKYFQDRKPLEHVENIGDKIGNGYPEIGVGFALLGTGELINDKKLADTGAVTLEAFVVNGIATEGLKYAVRRKRPNNGDNMSFPSGHASNTAMLAASVSEMYDWDLRIAVPLYMTTAFVGASRIQANEHFLSDVIAGMTVGTLAGMSVAKYHKEKDAQSGLQDITLLPVLDKDLRGWVLTLRFL